LQKIFKKEKKQMFEEYSIDKMPGHWFLARMGKKVLRPGGRELTFKMLDSLRIGSEDIVVEFAPGMGSTARLLFEKKPKKYIGIDLNEEAIAHLSKFYSGNSRAFIKRSISNSGLDDSTATIVLGEAVLTMQTDEQKQEIIKEAYRILGSGGKYAIHEIALQPEEMDEALKEQLRKDLSAEIRVNARPLTVEEWKNLFSNAGFTVEMIHTNPMHLLNLPRLIRDEGIAGLGKIIYNVVTTRGAAKRVKGMKRVFTKYEKNMKAVSIIGVKN